MAKTTIPTGICSELGAKSRIEQNFDINALRKPLKMTATLKRRALKKKDQAASRLKVSDGAGTAADRPTRGLPGGSARIPPTY
jgi:hypothetical protein